MEYFAENCMLGVEAKMHSRLVSLVWRKVWYFLSLSLSLSITFFEGGKLVGELHGYIPTELVRFLLCFRHAGE